MIVIFVLHCRARGHDQFSDGQGVKWVMCSIIAKANKKGGLKIKEEEDEEEEIE